MTANNILANGERSQLINLYGHRREQYLEWLRRKIIVDDRVDILASEVLGYQLKPFHLNLIQTQHAHPENNLQLVGRGHGKSTLCTVTRAIWYLCKYPKARIVIASKTVKQAQARLKEIAAHFESNELLIELFGEFYNKSLWNAREIEIAQRYDPKNKNTPGAKAIDSSPSIGCVGATGSIAGAHFDIEFSDDLIDKTNSFTEITREEVNEWYNATFTPMLDPPDPDIPFRYHRHRVGTRYHLLDQYGRWIKQARIDHKEGIAVEDRMWINVIPAYDYKDTSNDPLEGLGLGIYTGRMTGQVPWPERFTPKQIEKIKRQVGHIAFYAQFLNDIDVQNGEIFNMDHFVEVDEEEIKPLFKHMKFYIGVDLAISEKESADSTAIVVVGKLKTKEGYQFYIVDSFNQRGLRFSQQTAKIRKLHNRWNKIGHGVIKVGIETVAYQNAQYQTLQEKYPDLKSKLKKIDDKKGKDARAYRRQAKLDENPIHILTRKIKNKTKDGIEEYEVIPAAIVRDQMILFPSGDHDDSWDAFDHAMTVADSKVRKSGRRKEPGLL